MYKQIEYYLIKYSRLLVGIGLVVASVYLHQIKIAQWEQEDRVNTAIIDGLKNDRFDTQKALEALDVVMKTSEQKNDTLQSCIRILGIVGLFITFFTFRVEKHNKPIKQD
jgi:hypothetical protein